MNNYAILKWYQLSGITEIISELPIDRFKLFKQSRSDIAPVQVNMVKEGVAKSGMADATLSLVAQAEQTAASCDTLDLLKAKMETFDGCSLKKTALNTFIGMGEVKNPIVFCVFDAPKAPADKTGCIFDGPTGTLMQKMLQSIGLTEKNSFVAPLIAWRLPGDRKPTLVEEKICTPFLKRQIELVNPDFILIFGAVATRALLGIESISKARQQTNMLLINNKNIPVIATFGPDMVSASQTSRRNAWDDLKKLSQLVQEKISN